MSKKNPSVLWTVSQELEKTDKETARANLGLNISSASSTTGNTLSFVDSISEDATTGNLTYSKKSVTVDQDTYSSENPSGNPASAKTIKKALETLDGGKDTEAGYYVKHVKQTDGLVSVTTEAMDTSPTANSNKPVTSGGVHSAIQSVTGSLENLDYVKTVSIDGTALTTVDQNVNIPLAVSEEDSVNKKNGAMSSVDKYKVDNLVFPLASPSQYASYLDNRLVKVTFPGSGEGRDMIDMFRVGRTSDIGGPSSNSEVWIGSCWGHDNGNIGFYKYVGPDQDDPDFNPESYLDQASWEPYPINTVRQNNTIDDKMVYLDTLNGNDDNTGLTVDQPVQTVYRAFRVFANAFYYGDGKTARIRVLDDNANVLLDNSYDEDNYAYFDWIAFYGTGNVTFVYALEADDQGKLVDNTYRNNLWAEFDGNITIVGASHTYCRMLHIESRYGDITLSGTVDTLVSGHTGNTNIPEIYLNAGGFTTWSANSMETNGYINIFILAGLGIYTTGNIKCTSIQMKCGKYNVYMRTPRVSPYPYDVHSDKATERYIVNKGIIEAEYVIFMESDYISIDAPIRAHGNILLKNTGKVQETDTTDYYSSSLYINSPIDGSNSSPTAFCNILNIDFPNGYVALNSSIINMITSKITCHEFSANSVSISNSANISAAITIDAPKIYFRSNGGSITGYDRIDMYSESLELTRITIQSAIVRLIGRLHTSYNNASAYTTCSFAPWTGSKIDTTYINFDQVYLQESNLVYEKLLHIVSTSKLELDGYLIQAKQIKFDTDTLIWKSNLECGGIDIRCNTLDQIRKDTGGEYSPYIKLVENISHGSTSISTADVENTSININRLNYVTDPSISPDSFALLWINKDNANIIANVGECNSRLVKFGTFGTDSTVKINAKINMMNSELFTVDDSLLPTNINMKVVSDFDTYGSNPGTIPGYDYKYIVISDAVGITVHTTTVNP